MRDPGGRARPLPNAGLVAWAVVSLLALSSRTGVAAQSRCPATGVGTTSVTITQPRPGEVVSGVVPVRGEARTIAAPLSRLHRVELYVNGSLAQVQESAPATRLPFQLSWDSTWAGSGPATLRVVACGGGAGARGQSTVPVTVQPPQRASTTTSAASMSAVPTTTVRTPVGAATTASTPTTRAAPTTTVSTTASESLDEARPAPRPSTPDGRRIPSRLALRGSEPEEGRSSPLWGGAVVGLTGAAGLALSTFLRRRRPPAGSRDLRLIGRNELSQADVRPSAQDLHDGRRRAPTSGSSRRMESWPRSTGSRPTS